MSVNFGKVFLFGDSLTQYSFSPSEGGWGATVADHFQRRADVINRGFSGYNTEWAKLILPQILVSKEQADVVVIFFGANDSSLAEANPKQHVPLAKFKSNIGEMCAYLNSIGMGSSSLILVTPPALCESKWAVTCQERGEDMTDRSGVNTQKYAQAVLEVGKEMNIITADLFGELVKRDNLEEDLLDGLHFSTGANKVLSEIIIPLLEEKLQEQFPNPVFPLWRDIDPKNIEQSLGLQH